MDFRLFFPPKKGVDNFNRPVDFMFFNSQVMAIKNGTISLDPEPRVNGFYIQTQGYAEKVYKEKLGILEDIYKKLRAILDSHILNSKDIRIKNSNNINELLCDLMSSCLDSYEEMVKWRNEVSHLNYDLRYDSLFSGLYQAPSGFLGAFEDFCLALPGSGNECINQCIKSIASGQPPMESIPFISNEYINVSSNTDIFQARANKSDHIDFLGDTKEHIAGSDDIRDLATGCPNYGYSATNYYTPPNLWADRESRLVFKEKRPGWESLMFAIEVRARIEAIKKERNLSADQYKNTGFYIQTTAYAIQVCKSNLVLIEDIAKRLVGIVNISITTQHGCGYEEARHIIGKAVQNCLQPYVELNSWMKGVLSLRYHPRFHSLFSLLQSVPVELMSSCENFYFSLYDHFSQQGNGSWRAEVKKIDLEIIHKELIRLSHQEFECNQGEASLPFDTQSLHKTSNARWQKWRYGFKPLEKLPIAAHEADYSLVTDGEPVTVRQFDEADKRYSIPTPEPKQVENVLQLDLEKISVIEVESKRVSSMLNTIFVDETENSATQSNRSFDAEPTHVTGIWGLSQEFSDFLWLIATRPEWSRTELEELAKTHSLMLDGALEHINEAALDRYDLPLTEGDDPLSINQELIKEITS